MARRPCSGTMNRREHVHLTIGAGHVQAPVRAKGRPALDGTSGLEQDPGFGPVLDHVDSSPRIAHVEPAFAITDPTREEILAAETDVGLKLALRADALDRARQIGEKQAPTVIQRGSRLDRVGKRAGPRHHLRAD